MTDPVLAALLADPAPDARAIAADLAHDCGEELLEAWLRVKALKGEYYQGSGTANDIFVVAIHCEPGGGFISAWHECHGHLYLMPEQSKVTNQRGDSITPPPGLEAAVLAVLRRRLAEVRA